MLKIPHNELIFLNHKNSKSKIFHRTTIKLKHDTVSGNLGGFVSSSALGWSSPMVEKLKGLDDNPIGRKLDATELSLLASLSILGSVVACILVSILGSRFGRKTLFASQGAIVAVFYLVMAWVECVWLLLISRFLVGVGVGCLLIVTSMYLGEIAEAKNRGMIGTSMTTAMNAGMLFSLAAGSYLPYFYFHLSLAVISVLYTIMAFVFAQESPYYTIKYDRNETRNTLKKLRGDKDFEETLNDMEKSVNNVSKVSFMEIVSNKASVKTILIGMGAFTFMQLTGVSIFVSYTESILKDAGDPHPKQGPIIINIVQFIISLLVPLIADRFPRKILLILSHAGITLSLIPLGIYFNLKLDDYDGIDKLSWLPLTCLILISSFYSFGVAPVLMTLLGELFAAKTKNVIVSFLTAYNLGVSFLITLLYKSLQDAIHDDNLVWIFAASGLVAIVFVKFFMIETRGKSLQEIQDELDTRYN